MRQQKIKIGLTTSILLPGMLLGYIALGPFISLYHIKQGVEQKDIRRLNTYIDFESLQKSVKKQIQKNISESLGVDLSQTDASLNPLMALVYELANTVIETAVVNIVSPGGIALLLSGEGVDLQAQTLLAEKLTGSQVSENEVNMSNEIHTQQSAATLQKNKSEIEKFLVWLKTTEFRYDSHQQFSVFLTDKEYKTTQLVLTRSGIAWKLSDVILNTDPKR